MLSDVKRAIGKQHLLDAQKTLPDSFRREVFFVDFMLDEFLTYERVDSGYLLRNASI